MDVTKIEPDSWHPNWPLQEVNVQVLGIGTLSQVKQNTRWVKCIETEEQRRKLKSHVANTEMNLWEHYLLQQWNTQINIPPILEANNKLSYVPGKNIRKC